MKSIAIFIGLFMAAIMITCCGGSGSGGGSGNSASTGTTGGGSTGGQTNPVCVPAAITADVQAPVFVRNLSGQTSWFASPIVADLDGDNENELIAAYYSVYVFSATGDLLDRADGNGARIYAPHVVTDLEGDGIYEIACGQSSEVYVYEWRNGELNLKSGWPADTDTAGNSPEIRGMAAADLDGNGTIEIVVTNTNGSGAQVFAFNSEGGLYQPAGVSYPAWPRYNTLSGTGGDAGRNGPGHNGYGCYGLNVGIGGIDDDPELEIIVTYDNHHIQVFDHDGVAHNASAYFTNRSSSYQGNPLTWGQFIRWADPLVEKNHYNLHTGDWPHPDNQEWLQWTQSPPNVADIDGDGDNEVIGIPNVERYTPYVTQAYAVMVLEGTYGDGQRSARRLTGWENLPRGDAPIDVEGWYPPSTPPAPATVNIQGDSRPEIVVTLNDGFVYAFDAEATELWRYNFTHGKPIMFASEVMAADLNRDGSPELIFSTFGDPNELDSGHLVILAANGAVLHDIALPNAGQNGNGNGAPAAPAIADLDGDGQLEIMVQTFEHGMDIFTVPGSGCDCLLWATARGGPLRMGSPNGN
ncbi:MAG: VCBS repeat-containing protein [Desulfobacteraceae bacterium]|nr:VCBS repeat-containing protein [Desulfobacteraceae bacterium]